MNTILYVSSLVFISLSVVCGILYILFASFSKKIDLPQRKASLLSMMRVCMIISIVAAFLVSLLSDNDSIGNSFAATVELCSVISICMLSIIILACAIHIVRLIIPRIYRDNFGISDIIKISGIGVCVSLVISWILG